MQPSRIQPSNIAFPVILLTVFMALLWVAGGASRADALGQVIVRVGAWAGIIAVLLVSSRPNFVAVGPVWRLLLLISLVPLLQIVPLPSAWLPELSSQPAFPIVGGLSVWRPLSVVPGATLNGLLALTIPVATFVFIALVSEKDKVRVVTIMLVFVTASVILALTQLSGSGYNSPLINDVPGVVSSNFANRNHLALLISMGCVLAPVWAVCQSESLRWRLPVALALVLLFGLTIIAIGSRSGLLLLTLSTLFAATIVGKRVKHNLHRVPKRSLIALCLVITIFVLGIIVLSFAAGRVDAIDRLFALAADEDLRIRSRDTVTELIRMYFPVGAGVGSFDPVFRTQEPTNLLAFQYFNQAHNDYLGIILDAGLLGVFALGACISWWVCATFKVVKANDTLDVMLGRLGSAWLLLIFVASVTDYPARTPIIMAITVIAAVWLAQGSYGRQRSALPKPVSTV